MELLMSTNEQLLDVDATTHAYRLYRGAGIPVVVGSDDAGILRTTLSGGRGQGGWGGRCCPAPRAACICAAGSGG